MSNNTFVIGKYILDLDEFEDMECYGTEHDPMQYKIIIYLKKKKQKSFRFVNEVDAVILWNKIYTALGCPILQITNIV